MIKTYCDKCKKEIDYEVNGISVIFNHYGCIDWTGRDKNIDLCKDCAEKVLEFVRGGEDEKNN